MSTERCVESERHFLDFSSPRKKLAQMGPNGGRRFFVPTNPDLADILGDMDFDFGFLFLSFWDPKFQDFQVPDFQKSGLGRAWAGLGLGGIGPGLCWAWAGLG
ncbi:MAG: hypothetical protein VX152_12075 [Pseudomonadota bacterium]|nr:hypothetical protein [Pseudomonadota bacterium]